jgi:pyruvate kinase
VRPLTPNTPLQATHQEALDNLRAAMHATSTLVATVMDTRGPEILVLNR